MGIRLDRRISLRRGVRHLFDDLTEDFPSDFGFEIPPQALHEIEALPKEVEIATLVDGFSRSETFDSDMVKAAGRSGFSRASCMMILYHFASTPEVDVPASAPLKFVGAVPA